MKEVLEVINQLHELMNKSLSWLFLISGFIFSSASLLLMMSPSLTYDKIDSMRYLYFIMIFVWAFFATLIIVKFGFSVYDRRKRKEKSIDTVKNAIKTLLALPEKETALLKYIYESPTDMVYVPCDDAIAISLWNKGMLKRLENVIYSRDFQHYKPHGRVCFLYSILPQLKAIIKGSYTRLGWKDIISYEGLDDYQ